MRATLIWTKSKTLYLRLESSCECDVEVAFDPFAGAFRSY